MTTSNEKTSDALQALWRLKAAEQTSNAQALNGVRLRMQAVRACARTDDAIMDHGATRRSRPSGRALITQEFIRFSKVASTARASSNERTRPRADRFSANGAMRDRPADKSHPHPIVVPFGKSRRDDGRCHLRRLALCGHRADPLEESRQG
jgi:hypothetical protein